MLVVHNESRKVYNVEREEGGYVYLKRLGDNFDVRLSDVRYIQKYHPITEEEITTLLHRQIRSGNPVQINEVPDEETATIEGGEGESTPVGTLYTPNEIYNFDRIVVTDEVKKSVRNGVKKIDLQDFLYNTLNLKSIDPVAGKCILNFYGVPGTGKSMTAKAIANELGKNLLQIDYSQIISKWVGDTAKHINEAFVIAAENDAILFFDEADSLLSKRLDFGKEAVATSINQNRNVLMQNIDKFDGIIILATNLFKNFDPALLRRINQHIEFKLPDAEMREEIIAIHVPEEVPLSDDVDYAELAEKFDGVSGGDIASAVKEAIVSAVVSAVDNGFAKEEAVVSQKDFITEFEKVVEAKKKHKGGGGLKQKIGFGDTDVAEEDIDDKIAEDFDLEESAAETAK